MSTNEGDNHLPMLAETIRSEHQQAEVAARAALEHGFNAGDALIEAKAKVPHGEWAEWLRANVPQIGERTAQLYMKLARNRDQLDPQRVADLSLRQAAKMVSRSKPGSKPKPPKSLGNQIKASELSIADLALFLNDICQRYGADSASTMPVDDDDPVEYIALFYPDRVDQIVAFDPHDGDQDGKE